MANPMENYSPLVIVSDDSGRILGPEFNILSMEVTKEYNRISSAELRYEEGKIASNEYKLLESGFFTLGNKIEISVPDETGANVKLFSGIVTNNQLGLNKIRPVLTIELHGEAKKMTSTRYNAVYLNKSDSEIISQLLKKHRLSPEKSTSIAKTNVSHEQMIQYYATDWDFMVARAEANGLVVNADFGKISVLKPAIKSSPDHTLKLGINTIYDCDLQVDTDDQYLSVDAVGWDGLAKGFSRPQNGKKGSLSQSDIQVDFFAEKLDATKNTLVSAIPADQAELRAWSESKVMKSDLSLIRGWIKADALLKVQVGDTLGLTHVSDQFAGNNVITGIRYEMSPSGWLTHLQLGMSSCWFTGKHDVKDTPAAGLLPAVNGLQIGLVKSFEQQTNGTFKVKVFVPAFGIGQSTIWARLASIDAGEKHGAYFIPEVNDEVIVGFINDDPRHAVILGSMHNDANKFPKDYQLDNGSKGLFTSAGLQMHFNEKDQQIRVSTSDKQQIVIDEKQKSITVEDEKGNQLMLDGSGISILSAADLKINCEGNLDIQANGKVTIKGQSVNLT
ncbi:MAG: type VI secretion system tip protein VgrG [Bacteroidota bacterium]